MVADWAPLLLVLGLTPSMREAIARRGGAPFASVTRLRVALPVWLAGWYLVHLAAFYDTALENPWLLNVEHLVLLAIGLLFWWPVISDVPHAPTTPAAARVPRRCVRLLGLPRARAHVRRLGLLRLLRERPALWGLSPSRIRTSAAC